MKNATCPYCGSDNRVTDDTRHELEDFGKAVIECSHCKTLYLLRNDGDGVFVSK